MQANPERWEDTRYFHSATVRASAGNGNEVRAALVEYVKSRQADGKRVALHGQVLSTTGATFVVTQTYETLSEYEIEHVTNSPPGLAELGAKIKSVMQSPAEFEMYEILV